MSQVFRALALAAGDATRPRMIALMLLPATAALLLWSIATWIWWSTWTHWVATAVTATWLGRLSEGWGGWIMTSTSALLTVVLLVPAVIVTALLINEIVAAPLVLREVRRRHYPALEARGFGTAWHGIANVLASGVLFVVLWVATLPLWLTVVGAVIGPLLNSAYLNMRVFRYDALAELATRDEYDAICRDTGGRLFALGAALAVLYYVPVANLVAPTVSALAYSHFCLAELQRRRAAAVQRR